MTNLGGLHDREATAITPPDTWVLDTIALSENPTPTPYTEAHRWICRANWGYGSTGTLPKPELYGEYVRRLTEYVRRSPHCYKWVIGNETNLSREWPDRQPIMPWQYAECYQMARLAIHGIPDHAHDEVLIAASGPWNDELKYPGNPNGDWIRYFADVIDACGENVDGFALHAYTHGYDPALVTSTAHMDAPFQSRYYNFLTYRDYLDALPEEMWGLPCYITEANGNGPWQAVGLMPAMLQEIDDWNQAGGHPIRAVIFYRYPKYDANAEFAIEGKADVIAEYHAAIGRGYTSPVGVTNVPETIHIPAVSTGTAPTVPTPDLPPREWDERLTARGVTVETPLLKPGQQFWRVARARWWNEQESQGRHHIYLEAIDEDGKPVPVAVNVRWPSGSTDARTNGQFGFDAGNFPMSKSLNEFSVTVDNDDYPSETLKGIGMGADGNSGIHTSTGVTFQLTTMPQAQPAPVPMPTIPVTPGNERDNWTRAIAFVREWEGGWADNVNDPGGATNKGITIGTFQRWRVARGLPMPTKDDLRNITDTEVNQIYYEWYWKESGADKLPWPLALAHFDTAVNAGPGRAKEMLQKSSGNFLAYMGHLIDWYTRINNFEHFGRAWIRRRADLLLEASK